MLSGSSFARHLRQHLRTSVIVVSIVALGLCMYSMMNDELVQWRVIGLVAAAMFASSIANTFYDVWKEGRRRPKS